MVNIHAMANRGVLVAAGPFDDTPTVISGVFFFATSSIEEARRVAQADPTVAEHRNTVEVLAWRGPAGIGDEYKRLHKEKPETPEGMGIHPFVILRRSGKELGSNADGAALGVLDETSVRRKGSGGWSGGRRSVRRGDRDLRPHSNPGRGIAGGGRPGGQRRATYRRNSSLVVRREHLTPPLA